MKLFNAYCRVFRQSSLALPLYSIMPLFVWMYFAAMPQAIVCASGQSELRNNVFQEIQKNTVHFHSGAISWNRSTMENGFSNDREFETSGVYKQWWDGSLAATESLEEGITELSSGQLGKSQSGQKTAFNGIDFRQVPNIPNPKDIAISLTPKYRLNENWFEVVGWGSSSGYLQKIARLEKTPEIHLEWSSIQENGEDFAKLIAKRRDKNNAAHYLFAVNKGGLLVREEWFDEQGKKYNEVLTTPQAFAGGWFPIRVETIATDPIKSKIVLKNIYELDLANTSLNDPSKIPVGIFEISLQPGMEVSDYRGGVRINYVMDTLSAIAPDVRNVISQFTEGNPKIAVTTTQPVVEGAEKMRGQPSFFQRPLYHSPLRRLVIGVGALLFAIGAWVCLRRVFRNLATS